MMGSVFGPVSSRRLGRSLGVDLVPLKTCSYDCLYCQAGPTTHKTAVPSVFVPVEPLLVELEARLKETCPDTVTFSGSGEPTLHSEIGTIISKLKTLTETNIAVLTNGSLLWREDVRERIRNADMVMPTLSTVRDDTFHRIHRPHESLALHRIIEGLERFRDVFRGKLHIEVVLLRGINDRDEDIETLAKALHAISPDRIQLNTVVRPPASGEAVALDRERLEAIRGILGERAEIIAGARLEAKRTQSDDLSRTILEMTKRRPVRALDLAEFLGLDLPAVEKLLASLHDRGAIRSITHEGDMYYSAVDAR